MMVQAGNFRVKGFFVTGTDTDCGKTRVACGLIEQLRSAGHRVAPFKPVAAGAEPDGQGRLRNQDALQLIAASGCALPYERVNPYCLAEPVSPHLAAAALGVRVDMDEILGAAEHLVDEHDLLVVEGAGGWRVPLAQDMDIRSLAVQLGLPVILVVGLRLGCLNHALLSAEAISASGLTLAGWVGNLRTPGMARLDGNIQTLRTMLSAPCLGVVPNLQPGESAARYLKQVV